MIKRLICLIWGHKSHAEPLFVIKDASSLTFGENSKINFTQYPFCKRCGKIL